MRTLTNSLAVLALILAPLSSSAITSTFDTDLEGWTAVGIDFMFTLIPPAINDINFVDNGADMVHEASGGNPGGYARLTDSIQDPSSFAKAPDTFLNGGDLTPFIDGTFSFDHKIFDRGFKDGMVPATDFGPYSLVITSGDPAELNSLVWIGGIPTGETDWLSMSVTLDESNLVLLTDLPANLLDPTLPAVVPSDFGIVGTKDFAEIMADVSSILVGLELVDNEGNQNEEHSGLDNISLDVVPEPGTGALLALGVLGLAVRRR